MKTEDIAKIPFDPVNEELHGRTVLGVPLIPRKYKRKEIWLSIFRVDDVRSLPYAPSP